MSFQPSLLERRVAEADRALRADRQPDVVAERSQHRAVDALGTEVPKRFLESPVIDEVAQDEDTIARLQQISKWVPATGSVTLSIQPALREHVADHLVCAVWLPGEMVERVLGIAFVGREAGVRVRVRGVGRLHDGGEHGAHRL